MNVGGAFRTPELLPLVALAPVLVAGLALLERRAARALRRVVGPRAARLAAEVSTARRRVARGLFGLALGAALLALAQPIGWLPRAALAPVPVDVLLCLDVSQSMLAQDVAPSRLQRAREELTSLAAAAAGDRLGLLVFAGEARLAVPLTRDLKTFAELAARADPLDVPRGGSDLGRALDVALEALRPGAGGGEGSPDTSARRDRQHARPAAIVLLTDGEDLGEGARDAAGRAAAAGVPVHTLLLGTARGAKIPLPRHEEPGFLRDRAGVEVVTAADPTTARDVAARTGGVVLQATTPDALAALHEQHLRPLARAAAEEAERESRPPRFQAALLAAFLALLIEAALGDRRRRPRGPAPPGRRSTERPGRHGRAPTSLRETPPAERGSDPDARELSRRGVTARLSALLLAALVALGARDLLRDAQEAYAEGRWADAFAAFAAEADARGDGAPSALLHDLALVAVRCGEIGRAERALEVLAARGEPDLLGRVWLLRGQVAWERCRLAAAQAAGPEAEPFAYDVALALGATARDCWQHAATTQPDWPAARRNVERALLLLERLQREKDEAVREARRAAAERAAQPAVLPPPEDGAGDGEQDGRTDDETPAEVRANEVELSPEALAALRNRLAEQEDERRALREAARRAARIEVERDW